MAPSKLIPYWEQFYGEKIKVKDMDKDKKNQLIQTLVSQNVLVFDMENMKGKSKNVMAFDINKKDHVKDIDWNMMYDRNIINKVETIFEALGWEDSLETLKMGVVNG